MHRRFVYDRTMESEPSFARLGALLGDPARANILSALKDGRACTAKELGFAARVSAPTTSSHLAKLADAGLITVEKSGRHRYYRLAGAGLADLLESLAVFMPTRPVPVRRPSEQQMGLARARMCYDHLAGHLGVAVTDALVDYGHLEPAGLDFALTPSGERFLCRLDVDVAAVKRRRRVFARQCLDWSERRHHLGGALGAAFATACLDRDWIRRDPGDRRVEVTEAGSGALEALLPSIRLTPDTPGSP
jgi:DNA-binding transcriptional ArsR family regulator